MSTKIQEGKISPKLTVDQEQITVNVAPMGVDQVKVIKSVDQGVS